MNKYTILFITVTIAIVACKHNPGNNINPAGNTNNPNNNNPSTGSDTGICFERDILPIFISNCAQSGCHDALSKQDGYQFTDYNSIVSKNFVPGNAGATELFEKINEDKADKIMPPPPAAPLTFDQKKLIERWINEGAKNTTNCGSSCDTNKFSFAANINPTIKKYCVACHTSALAPKGIVLDSYTGIVNAVDNGGLLNSIRHEQGYTPMPQGGSKLSDCEIRTFEKWVEAGKQNN